MVVACGACGVSCFVCDSALWICGGVLDYTLVVSFVRFLCIDLRFVILVSCDDLILLCLICLVGCGFDVVVV